MKFNLADLVVLEEVDGFSGRCSQDGCVQRFKALKTFNIKKHYESFHHVTFEQQRVNNKRIRDIDSPKNDPKKKCPVLHYNFASKEEYLTWCSNLQASNALSSTFWDDRYTKQMIQPFNDYFHVSVSGATMPLHLDAVCKKIKARVAKDLEGKMFSLKFDIGSRFGRSFLGVSVQYMIDFDVKVVFLGMP